MTQPKSGGSGPSSGGADPKRTKRRRTVLNLGMPFVPIDDFVNRSEEAVALGYKVLVETVEEIKKGYDEAKKFHEARQQSADGSTPPIPWGELVDRIQSVQNIGLDAIKEGTNIVLESVKEGMKSTQTLARTWAQSRQDIDENPVLAGPVFEEALEVGGQQGDPLPTQEREIPHRGLARLRIAAEVNPLPKELRAVQKDQSKSKGPVEERRTYGGDIKVSFEPVDDDDDKSRKDISRLTVKFGPIPGDQTEGEYEGLIRASNFELLIARLRINVQPKSGNKKQQA